jgi:hypothetical protein
VKVFDKEGKARVVIVKQKSVLSLDNNSLKKSSGTNTASARGRHGYRSQNSHLSKSPHTLSPSLSLSIVFLTLPLSRNSFTFDDDSSVSSSGSFTQKKVTPLSSLPSPPLPLTLFPFLPSFLPLPLPLSLRRCPCRPLRWQRLTKSSKRSPQTLLRSLTLPQRLPLLLLQLLE